MTDVNEIIGLMHVAPNEADKELIAKAYDFAKAKHEGQLRASGEPYFIHAFAVGKNLADLGMDARTIAAGLIHDTLEDTETTEKEIETLFGKEILFLVQSVTKLGTLRYQGRERHVESLRKFFIAVAEDVRVLIIKLADRLHNVSTLEHIRPDKQQRVAIETIQIYAPLAGRLGMGKLKSELEDYAFPFAYPDDYVLVERLLAEKTKDAQEQLEEIAKRLRMEIAASGMKDFEIVYRIKHKFSLYRKLKKYDMDIESIFDIVALRVIVTTIEDCYHVLGIVHAIWKPLPGRVKDYIALPKPNGYQSLHTSVLSSDGNIAEIQIRTKAMDDESEYGIASHFSYKENMKMKAGGKLKKKFEWIGQLKEIQKTIADPAEFLEHLTMDFFKGRIFVRTPKDDIIDLPEDASPIDFAYAIHSRIGDHVFGVRVNGKMVPLDSKLSNGNVVEILTKESAKPVPKWMEYAKTSMARKHIRQYFQKNDPDNAFYKKAKKSIK